VYDYPDRSATATSNTCEHKLTITYICIIHILLLNETGC
jgi:hypothetical protein